MQVIADFSVPFTATATALSTEVLPTALLRNGEDNEDRPIFLFLVLLPALLTIVLKLLKQSNQPYGQWAIA